MMTFARSNPVLDWINQWERVSGTKYQADISDIGAMLR